MKSRLENCFNGLICDSDDALALATVIQVISPTSAKPGDKALISSKGIVEGWIGGACVQNSIVKASEAAINQKQGQLIRVAPKGEFEAIDGLSDFSSGCLSRGSLLIFIEPLKKKTTLSVLGHSPVALKLASLASELDFQVSLISPDLDNKELPEKGVFYWHDRQRQESRRIKNQAGRGRLECS